MLITQYFLFGILSRQRTHKKSYMLIFQVLKNIIDKGIMNCFLRVKMETQLIFILGILFFFVTVEQSRRPPNRHTKTF